MLFLALPACVMTLANMTDVEKRQAGEAAMSMVTAMNQARFLITYAQVDHAIETALVAARCAQNCIGTRCRGFAVACTEGAKAINDANLFAHRTKAIATSAGEDELMKQIQKLIPKYTAPNGKGAGKDHKPNGKGTGKETKTRSSMVVLPNGTKKLFERKA